MTVRILLAEDNENLAKMLGRFLAGMGHDVDYAGSGTDALRLLAAGSFDLLVLDLRLPGMNGIDLLQKVRKSPKMASLPVIIMTGIFRGEKYSEAAGRLGVRHYLEKPFSRESFEAAINDTVATIVSERPKQTLLETLLTIYDKRQTGLLSIGNSSPIAMIKGEPASFLAAGCGDFPDFLVSRGKIGKDDAGIFKASGEERIFFVESGLLSYEDLQSESHLFLMKKLMESLSITDGISFREWFAAEPPLFHLSLPRLIYDAAKLYPHHFRDDDFLKQNSTLYPGRTALFYRRSNLLVMRKDDIDLLAGMNGQRTLAELAGTGGDARRAGRFFNFLHVMGMIRLTDQPQPEEVPGFVQKTLFNAPLEEGQAMEEVVIGFDDVVGEVEDDVVMAMGDTGLAAPLSEKDIGFEQTVQREYAMVKDKDYYAIFDMSPAKFSFNTLKEAYFAKMREYSPERFMELSGTTSNMAQEILAIYADAYNTLSNVVSKERYDEMLNENKTLGIDGKQDGRLHAKIQFQSGKVFLDMGEFENAEKALQEAYTLEPEDAANAAYLAWAIYRNPANSRSRSARERVQALLTKSLQMEKSAEAFAFRGWLLLDEGRDGLAEGEFQKSLKINPKEPNARKGMNAIAEKRENEKKGLLKRFFG